MQKKSFINSDYFLSQISSCWLAKYALFGHPHRSSIVKGWIWPSLFCVNSTQDKSESDSLLEPGTIHTSIGGQFSYRVLGACCRVFDREELPWPCCRLSWKSKEPSWRRIGKRFVPDIAAQRCPSYCVEILLPGSKPMTTVLTLFSSRFNSVMQEWWYSKHPRSRLETNLHPY